MNKFDLHIHSKFSDGALSIDEIIKKCCEENVKIISITDHDEVGGIEDAIFLGYKNGIQVIPGIEITTNWKISLHILGYDFDYTNEKIKNICKTAKMNRLIEFSSIISKLKKQGFDIDSKEIMRRKIITTSGLAKYLVEQGGYGNSVDEIKKTYFLRGGVAFVPKKGPQLEESIQAIHDAGGKAILAHPGRMKAAEKYWDYINEIRELGIDGIEVYSPHNTNALELREYCHNNNLIWTGGSDFHDEREGTLGVEDMDFSLNWIKKGQEAK